MSDVFRITNWYVQGSHLARTYKEIRAFLIDPVLIDKYLDNKIAAINAIENAQVEWNDENVAMFKEANRHPLERALEFYERQLIVAVSTYIELLLEEFLPLVFKKFPERMYQFVNNDESKKGLVRFKEITNAASMEELLSKLAEIATVNALSGGTFEAHLKRVEKITAETIPNDLKTSLVEVMAQRNRIVHEGTKEKMTLDEIKTAVDSYLDLLVLFNEIAKKSGIPIDNDITGSDFKRLERHTLWLGLS